MTPRMPAEPAPPVGCRLVALRADHDRLLVLLEADGRDVPVTIPINASTAHALRHLHALHVHPAGCGKRRLVHVDLLLRAVRAGGAWPLCVVVRPGPEPAFWLRIVRADEPVEVDLDVLDAVALLLADRLPITITDVDHDPWERTIDQLLTDRPM